MNIPRSINVSNVKLQRNNQNLNRIRKKKTNFVQ